MMMGDSFEKIGLFVDDSNEVRLLDPAVLKKSQNLKNLSDNFVTTNNEFQESVASFMGGLGEIAAKIEKEKFKAIGSRSLIKALEMEKEAMKEQYRNAIREKKQELERMRLEYESLKREETEQLDLLQMLRQMKR